MLESYPRRILLFFKNTAQSLSSIWGSWGRSGGQCGLPTPPSSAMQRRRSATWHRPGVLQQGYIAKQVLASLASHLSCFVTAPPQLLQRLTQPAHTFVAAQADRPSAHGANPHAAAMHPGRRICAMPWAWGGVNHVDIGVHPGLQARNMTLLEPERHAWKEFFASGSAETPSMRTLLSRSAI